MEDVGIYVLGQFEIYFSHFLHFMVIWYIFPRFGKLHQEKSGNPGAGIDIQEKICCSCSF
jgi:hypothetical protein